MFPDTKVMFEVVEWNIVNSTHKTQRAVYHVGGCVHSLLCTENGNNTFSESKVSFHLPKTSHYSNDFKSLKFSFDNNKIFKVYKKLARNQWISLGDGFITSIDIGHNRNNIFYISLVS